MAATFPGGCLYFAKSVIVKIPKALKRKVRTKKYLALMLDKLNKTLLYLSGSGEVIIKTRAGDSPGFYFR